MAIYHIADQQTWQTSLNEGFYLAQTLLAVGFIHCCEENQIGFVLNIWFEGCEDLLLITIDQEKIKSKVVFENSEGGDELFPHIYGPLNLDSIISIEPINRGGK